MSACYTEDGEPLVCPVCGGAVDYTVTDRLDFVVLEKAYYCTVCESGDMIGYWVTGAFDPNYRPDVALQDLQESQAYHGVHHDS